MEHTKQTKSIATLKQLITTAKELSEPFNYFFDLVDDNILFSHEEYRLIDPEEKHAELLAVLEAVKYGASQQLNQPVEIASHTFFEIPSDHFYHGVCVTHAIFMPMTVLYCSDMQVGMVAIAHGGKSDILRFILAKESDLQRKH